MKTKKTKKPVKKPAAKKPTLLAGGNPRIAKGEERRAKRASRSSGPARATNAAAARAQARREAGTATAFNPLAAAPTTLIP